MLHALSPLTVLCLWCCVEARRHVLSNDVGLPARLAQLSIQERKTIEAALPSANALRVDSVPSLNASIGRSGRGNNGLADAPAAAEAGDGKDGGDSGSAGTSHHHGHSHHGAHHKHRNDTYLSVAAADVPDGMFKDHILVCGAGSSLLQLARAILSQPFVPLQYTQADSLNSILDDAEAATWEVVVLAPAKSRPQ